MDDLTELIESYNSVEETRQHLLGQIFDALAARRGLRQIRFSDMDIAMDWGRPGDVRSVQIARENFMRGRAQTIVALVPGEPA